MFNVTPRPSVLSNDLIEAIAQRRTGAQTELSRICSGERRFTMSIPVQMSDSDHILHWALEDSQLLEHELYRLRGMLKVILAEREMPPNTRDALMATVFGAD